MKNLKHVLRYLKKYIPFMVISIVLSVIIVAFTLYVPIVIGEAIDQIVYGAVRFDLVQRYMMRVLMLVLATALSQWIMNIINNKVTYHVVRDIRNEAFAKIQKLPLSYLDAHSTGDIVSKMITDVDTFADGLLMGFTQVFTGIMTILGTLFFMLTIHPRIALLVVCVTPLSLLVANFIAKHTFSMFEQQSKTRGEQTAFIDPEKSVVSSSTETEGDEFF